jgi:predicted RND superfamily exporter protein
MSTIIQLNNSLREVQSAITTATQTLNNAQTAYNSAWSTDVTNFLSIYRAKRAALYNNEANQYHCPTLYSPGKKRDECTAQLKAWVDQNTSKQSAYLAARTKTDLDLKNAKAALESLRAQEATLLDQIKEVNRISSTLADKGLTSDAVEKAAQIEAEATGEAQAQLITAQAQSAEADAAAKRNRNMIIAAVGIIAVIAIGFVVYRKFIAKKKGVK